MIALTEYKVPPPPPALGFVAIDKGESIQLSFFIEGKINQMYQFEKKYARVLAMELARMAEPRQ